MYKKFEYLDPKTWKWNEIPFKNLKCNMHIRVFNQTKHSDGFERVVDNNVSEWIVIKEPYRSTYPEINIPKPLGFTDDQVEVIDVEPVENHSV